MKKISLFIFMILMTGASFAQNAQEFYEAWETAKIADVTPSKARHKDIKNYLEKMQKIGIKTREVGRSLANREIYEMEFGRGETKVFMWSQMHGDEPTATGALFDLFNFLQTNRNLAWVKRIEEKLTIRAVPMLNPDGAELFQRRNLQFIDINRDARQLATPEGVLLNKLRDEWSPDIGFNLHNQNPRYSVGKKGKQVAIGLLAVASDEARTDTPGRLRAKRVSSVMIQALNPFIEGRISRYDDTYSPRAFGDQFSRRGTPTILIESGGYHGKDEFYLVRMNFVMYLSALNALADGSEKKADPQIYESIPENEIGFIFDLIIRNATIINRFETENGAVKPFKSDIAVNAEQRGGGTASAFVQDIGDLLDMQGLEEFDAKDFYVVSNGVLRLGAPAELLFYRRNRPDKFDWSAKDLEKRFKPDGIYRNGGWQKKP